MNKGELEHFIHNRTHKSLRSLEEVELMLGIGHFETAASRLYYASFYLVSAALAKRGFSTKSHDGTQRLFGR